MKLVSLLLLIASVVITTAYDYSLDGHQLRRGAESDSEIDNEIEPEGELRHLNEDVLLTGINRIPTTRGIGYHYSGSSGKDGSKGGGKGSKSGKPHGKGKGSKGSKGSKGNKGAKYHEKSKKEKYDEYGKRTKPYY